MESRLWNEQAFSWWCRLLRCRLLRHGGASLWCAKFEMLPIISSGGVQQHLSVHTELSWELGQRVRGSIQNVLESRSPHPHFTTSQVLTLLLFIQFVMWKTLCFTYMFSFNPLVYSLKRFPPSPLENKWVPNMNGLPKVKQVVSGQARIELWCVSFHFIPKHLIVLFLGFIFADVVLTC